MGCASSTSVAAVHGIDAALLAESTAVPVKPPSRQIFDDEDARKHRGNVARDARRARQGARHPADEVVVLIRDRVDTTAEAATRHARVLGKGRVASHS